MARVNRVEEVPNLPSNIPARARVVGSTVAASLPEQGQRPRLTGVPEEQARAVRARLNQIRRADLTQETDCWKESLNLQDLAGGKGSVQEGNATSAITRYDHTMWEIGGEYVDTRPGMWQKYFREHPDSRTALDRAVPGLPARLEQGAVLTRDEFLRYQGHPRGPRSDMFTDEPIPRRPDQRRFER